ncbi:hypothetical protein Bca52824_044370 [Brassica carinata]|uniref:Uncharacterized protein n=1 Tax=Brassica carinata TaxID=52824 RepID=A0A8X7S1D6_BRACI|nr:hypothetical protein Bca52824_044370 [Brassica carinata]
MASEIDLPPFSPLRKSRSFNSLSLPPSSSALSVEGLEIETDQTLPSSFSLPPTDPVIGTNTTSLLEPVFPLSEPVAPLSPLTSEAVTVHVCDSPSKYLASVNTDNAGDDSSSKLASPVTFGSHSHVNSLMNSLAKNSVSPSVLDVLPQSASIQKPSSLGHLLCVRDKKIYDEDLTLTSQYYSSSVLGIAISITLKKKKFLCRHLFFFYFLPSTSICPTILTMATPAEILDTTKTLFNINMIAKPNPNCKVLYRGRVQGRCQRSIRNQLDMQCPVRTWHFLTDCSCYLL